MQWDATASAGFSTGEPWLPVAAGYTRDNVERERRDPASMLELYRRLIAARRRLPSLRLGHYRPIAASGGLLLYVRECPGERTLVGLNLGGHTVPVTFPGGGPRGKVLVSSAADRDGAISQGGITLRGNEGLVMALAPDAVVPPSVV